MGGVGKTTMTEHLKKATEDKKMFDWIVKAVIGQKINMLSIQQAVAEYMGQPLIEMSITARADRLRISLPKLTALCNTASVIELPQLVELILDGLPDFTSIYPEKTSATSSMSNNISAIQLIFNRDADS
ncbi:unnamed protein product [Lactuca saligna]|uniref:NB-ARC domain-containing protein n=1 Tax=Lactuca saligna TaxID=75948 RepID=A0AA35VQP4_LACSI|nr:unnamed protein product [Lactuca saligna]